MNRLLKILLYAVVLFFLFLWLSTIVKSCGADKDATPPATTTADAEDNTEEAYDEEFFEENDGDEDTDVDPSDMSDGTEENIDYTEIDKVVEDKLNNNTTEPASSSTPATSTRPSSNNNSSKVTSGNNRGKYMVMAGSFLIEKNAEGLRKKLVNLGYNNADVVVKTYLINMKCLTN